MENDDVTRCPTCNQKPPSRLRERSPWTPIRTAEDLPKGRDGWLVTVENAQGNREVEARWGGLVYERGGYRIIAIQPVPEPYAPPVNDSDDACKAAVVESE